MIHLRNRTGAVGHRNCGLTDSHTRAGSLSLALQVNYAPAAEEVKAAQQGFQSEDWRSSTCGLEASRCRRVWPDLALHQ
jgi:hypothetical protein